MHSGRTPESRHDQTRVIGEDQPLSVPRVMQRLAGRVFCECWSVFFERGKHIETRQQCQINHNGRCARRREHAIFGELPRIG